MFMKESIEALEKEGYIVKVIDNVLYAGNVEDWELESKGYGACHKFDSDKQVMDYFHRNLFKSIVG